MTTSTRRGIRGLTALATMSLLVPLAPLAPAAAQTETGAVVDLEGCDEETLAPNDDASTVLVPMGFEINLAGQLFDATYVNNNGNLTFEQPLSQFTPEALDENGYPIVAPFFADVDTRGSTEDTTAGEDINLVTYGQTTYGGRDAFCATFTDVGYFPSEVDKLNTFQVLIVDRSDVMPGAADLIYNYDEVTWETGGASGGVDGFGGESVAVGYSSGTGELGTFLELPCSRVNGACLDDDPETGLTNTSTNSAVLGRHVIALRHDHDPLPSGTLEGDVTRADDGSTVDGARVEACPLESEASRCRLTVTQGGHYQFNRLPLGTWNLRVSPAGTGLNPATAAAALEDENATVVVDIEMHGPTPPPEGISVDGRGQTADGIPNLFVGSPATMTVDDCATAPTFQVLHDGQPTQIEIDGQHVTTGTMVPDGDGGWTVEFIVNVIGPVEVVIDRDEACGGPVSFDMYIDPSGVVVDRAGTVLPGATVTLLRSSSEEGPFTQVPDGSNLMAPSNRTNPDLTDDDGWFGWDVVAGYYVVEATLEGCGTAQTEVLEVPPPHLDLVIVLPCGEPDVSPPTCADAEEVAQFPDVNPNSPHADNIRCSAGLGVVKGKSGGIFDPRGDLTRGQAASVLLLALEASGIDLPDADSEFTDIEDSAHATAIRKLSAAGIISGRTATTFEPGASITRGQVASLLDGAARELLAPYPEVEGPRFEDLSGSPHAEAIDRLHAAGIISGQPGGTTFGPRLDISRAQAASLYVLWLEDQAERLS